MFFDFDLLFRQHNGRLGYAWTASTRGVQRLRPQIIINVDLVQLCENIISYLNSNTNVPRERFSLRLSSILTHGTIRIYEYQIKHLLDELSKVFEKVANKSKISQDNAVIAVKKPRRKRQKVIKETPEDELEQFTQRLLEDAEAVTNPEIPSVQQPAEVSQIMVPSGSLNVSDAAKHVTISIFENDSVEDINMAHRIETPAEIHNELPPRRYLNDIEETASQTVQQETEQNLNNIEHQPPQQRVDEIQPLINEAQDEIVVIHQTQPDDKISISSESLSIPKRPKKKPHVIKAKRYEFLFMNSKNENKPPRNNRYKSLKVEIFKAKINRIEFQFLPSANLNVAGLLNEHIDNATANVENVLERQSNISNVEQQNLTSSLPAIVVESTDGEFDLLPSPQQIPLFTQKTNKSPLIQQVLPVIEDSKQEEGLTPVLKKPRLDIQKDLSTPAIDILLESEQIVTSTPSPSLLPPSIRPETASMTPPLTSYEVRQQKIVEKLKLSDKPLTLEELVDAPITKLKIAQCFNDLLVLKKAQIVSLRSEENSCEFKDVVLANKNI